MRRHRKRERERERERENQRDVSQLFEPDTVFSHPALPHYVSELFSPAMAAGAHSYEREYTIVHGSLVAIKVQLKVTVQPLVGNVGGPPSPRPRGSAGQVDTLSPELLHLLGLGFAASVGGAGVGGAAGTPSEAVPQTPGTFRSSTACASCTTSLPGLPSCRAMLAQQQLTQVWRIFSCRTLHWHGGT